MSLHLKTESRRHRTLRKHQQKTSMGQKGATVHWSDSKFTGPEDEKLSILQRLKKRMGI